MFGGPDSWHNGELDGAQHADNPSLWPLGNGSLLLAYATKLKHAVGPHAPKFTGHKHVGLAIGELADASGGGRLAPFRDVTPQPVFPFEAEDPTIFYDATNTLSEARWHILAHRLVSNVSRAVCAHAVAADPRGPWTVASEPAYTAEIEWAGEGGAVSATRVDGRERPHVLLDRSGRPVALSTGVTVGSGASPVTPQGHTGDYSFTLVQMLDPLTLHAM